MGVHWQILDEILKNKLALIFEDVFVEDILPDLFNGLFTSSLEQLQHELHRDLFT